MTKGVYWIMTKVEDFIKDSKISEVIGMAKLNDILGREEKEKKPSKTMIIFAVIGIIVAVAAAVYGVYRFFTPDYLDDFEDDFEDDFDNDFFEDEEDDVEPTPVVRTTEPKNVEE